jgi:hypothetical protein
MLACAMDPTTQEFIESEILQKKEIKDILKYVSTVLEELIGNNGEVIKVIKPIDFQVSKLTKIAQTTRVFRYDFIENYKQRY